MHLLVASLWLKMSTQLTYNKTQLGQSTDLPIIATKLPQQQFLTIFWIFPFPIAEIIRPQILYDSLRKKRQVMEAQSYLWNQNRSAEQG